VGLFNSEHSMHHHHGWLISPADVAGAKVQEEFPSPPTWSQTLSILRSKQLFWYALGNRGIFFEITESPVGSTGFGILVPRL